MRGVRIGAITAVHGPFAPAAGQDVVDVVIAGISKVGSATSSCEQALRTPRHGRRGWRQAPVTASPEYLQTREALRQWRLTQPLEQFRPDVQSQRRAIGCRGGVTVKELRLTCPARRRGRRSIRA